MQMRQHWNAIVRAFQGCRVRLISVSQDLSRFLGVSGPGDPKLGERPCLSCISGLPQRSFARTRCGIRPPKRPRCA